MYFSLVPLCLPLTNKVRYLTYFKVEGSFSPALGFFPLIIHGLFTFIPGKVL